jgi:SAM-dependent methyltransferase
METLYIHDEVIHNINAAKEVLPFIMQSFSPTSIIDIGCGIGTWLKVAKDLGVKEVIGVDGSYTDKRLLKINSDEFVELDLREQFFLGRKFDLAICLEVAEHLSESKAENLVNTLCAHSDIILFSAAIPGQGGQHHLNEQWPDYWVTYFEKNGFVVQDLLRAQFWNNEKVEFWYRQNMFIFKRKIKQVNADLVLHYVHPGLIKVKNEEITLMQQQLYNLLENPGVKQSFNLFYKALKRKIGF